MRFSLYYSLNLYSYTYFGMPTIIIPSFPANAIVDRNLKAYSVKSYIIALEYQNNALWDIFKVKIYNVHVRIFYCAIRREVRVKERRSRS